jgi:hypothetical protein
LNPVALFICGQTIARTIEALFGVHRAEVVSNGPGTCSDAADYTPLAALPPGRVLGFIDAGPLILAQTSHVVLAAPYHRNGTGNSAMLDIMLGSPEEAVARLKSQRVDYVVFCPGAPERYTYAHAAPSSFVASLAANRVPPGLERIDIGRSDPTVYRFTAVLADQVLKNHRAGSNTVTESVAASKR